MDRIRTGRLACSLPALAALLGGVYAGAAAGQPVAGDGWQLAGRLGMMQLVVVDDAHTADEATHRAAIGALCPPQQTCFVRFYANPQKLPLTVPLPDAIAGSPTAFYSRSAKQSNATFQWSCRVRNEPGRCF